MEISEDDYIRHYKSMPEKKSSSPSGLHVGHRIVAARAENGLLRRLDIKIAQLALWAAAPLPRWGQCILTMLEKPGKGPYLEKLRIIQLVESDLNFVLGLIWGKRLGKKVVQEKLIEATQFATRGQLCTSAALTTCLFNDIHRQTRETAATAMLDAKACFDRNLPALSIPVSRKYGVPQEAALFLFRALRAMHFRIRTAHGTSVKSFSAMDNPAEPLQGFGQGAAELPGLHTCTADVSNKALAEHHRGALLQHPDRSFPPVTQQKSLFMDDTSLYANLAAITARLMKQNGWTKATAAAQALKHLIQTYSQYLWTTGGRLALDKCYWYLLRYIRHKDGKYRMVRVAQSTFPMDIKEVAEDGCTVTVPQLEPDDARRGLGIVGAPDGSQTAQQRVLLQKAISWAHSIRASSLHATEVWTAYSSVLMPGLLYPLAVTSLSIGDLKAVQQRVSKLIRNSLHLNKSFPDALFYGAKRYGGLGMIPLIVHQCVLKLALFLRHIHAGDTIGQQLLISIGNTQLELGIGTPFFHLDYKHYAHLITETWTTHLWQFLSLANTQLWQAPAHRLWAPSLQRVADTFIMDEAMRIVPSLSDQRIINEWRVFLRASSIADLVNGNGTKLNQDAYHGWRSSERTSTLKWPVATRPHSDLLHIWQGFLRQLLTERNILKVPLGAWLSEEACHKRWNYRLDPMGGLWRFDPILGAYVELEQSLARTRKHQKRFFRLRFAEPLQLATPEDTAPWRTADIVERSHLLRLTTFITTTDASHHSRVPTSPATLMPARTYDTRYSRFLDILDSMDDITCRHSGISSYDPPTEAAFLYVADLYAAGALTCVSDGSFHPGLGRGSHAWIMTDDRQQYSLYGAGPVDGNPSTMSAYRPELQGVLANLLVLRSIHTALESTAGAGATLVCDNEAATVELDKIVSDPLHVIDSLQTDYDLLLQIQGEIKRSTSTFIIRWVKGHQEDNVSPDQLDFLALLNIDCDRRAKAFLRLNLGAILPPPVIFEHEKWGAIANGQKITSDLRNTIYELYTSQATLAYIRKKFTWDQSCLATVAWEGLRNAKSTLPLLRNTFTSKIIFDKLPVAERLNFFDPRESPLCKTCNLAVETQQHLLQCRDRACRKHRLNCWIKHSKTFLTKGHTARLIMDAIDGNVRHYLNLPPRPARWQTSQGNRSVSAAVQRAIVAQNKLGWDKFLSGLISTKWGVAQRLYQEISGDYPNRRPRTWAEGIIASLWEFNHDIWLYRNAIKHGVTQEEQRIARRARVVALVNDRYLHRPHLDPKYKFLYNKPLHKRLEEGNRALYTWLSSVANLSSLSTKPATRQQSIDTHATFMRLSDTQMGRLRRPLRRLRRLSRNRNQFGNSTAPAKSKYALGRTATLETRLLTSMWNFATLSPPVPAPPSRARKKVFHNSTRSRQAKLVWDRGRQTRHLI